MPCQLLQRIIGLLATPDMTEITIEVNPEDVDSEFVRWLDDTPVSRVSMGIQSLRDEELIAVGRRHTASDALKALDLLCLTRKSLWCYTMNIRHLTLVSTFVKREEVLPLWTPLRRSRTMKIS